MYRKPDWNAEGQDWPNRAASRFVEAGGLRWHVQVMGEGKAMLLLHGAGAATHSWRMLAPLLARRFTVVAPDLPGHGFTQTPRAARDLSLPGMARALAALLTALKMAPAAIVGHSAGAAIALRMTLDRTVTPRAVVAINGALTPFPGVASLLLPQAAKLFLNPLAVHAFARRGADPARVERLMRSTGSRIDAAGLEFYGRLFRAPGHVAGVLGMMAHWDLGALGRDLPHLQTPLTLIAGAGDRAVPPGTARSVEAKVPGARVEVLAGGHLVHEEAPEAVGDLVARAIEGLPRGIGRG